MFRYRLLGLAIILKAVLPMVIVTSFFCAVLGIAVVVSNTFAQARVQVDTRLAEAAVHVEAIQAEAERLQGEVEAIQAEGERFANEVEKAFKPVTKAVDALGAGVTKVTGDIEKTINGVIKAVNKIPAVKLKLFKMPKLKLPKLNLPSLDLNLDLEVDWSGVEALQATADLLQEDLQAVGDEFAASVSFWLLMVKLFFGAVALWFLLVMASFLMRVKARIVVGVRLMRGLEVVNASEFF